MYLSPEKLKKIALRKGFSLKTLLRRAKVSKTAYYSLARKTNLLPKSILQLAQVLEIRPSAFIEETSADERKAFKRLGILEEILRDHPEADRDNIWHSLILLDEKPIERLQRSILRANTFNFFRKRSGLS